MKTYHQKLQNNIKLLHIYSFSSYFLLYLPIKILFFVEITGNFTLAMSLLAIQRLSSAFLEIPTGFLSDIWGRKWVCVAGATSLLLAFICWSFANNYTMLFLGAVLNGLYNALSSGNNSAFLYESLDELEQKDNYLKEISKNISYLQFSLGLAALMSIFLVPISLRMVIIANIIPATIALIVTLFLTETKHSKDFNENIFRHSWNSLKHIFKNYRLKYLTIAHTLHYGFNEAAFDFNSVFFKQFIPEWSLGIFRSLGHFSNSIGNRLSHKSSKIFGLKKTIIFGSFADNIINIISVLLANIFSPFIKILTAFCNGIKDPALETIIQNDCSNKERATIFSIMSLCECIFYTLCALGIGYLADLYNPYWAMLIAYSLALLSNYFFIIALKRKQKICS